MFLNKRLVLFFVTTVVILWIVYNVTVYCMVRYI